MGSKNMVARDGVEDERTWTKWPASKHHQAINRWQKENCVLIYIGDYWEDTINPLTHHSIIHYDFPWGCCVAVILLTSVTDELI